MSAARRGPAERLFAHCPAAVSIVEVGPRDGLQNERTIVPTEEKERFIEALAGAGLRHIEVSSFVRPDLVPQLADAAEVFAGIERLPGVRYTALVPNDKGLERALEARVDSIAVLTAASETFSVRNLGCGVRESIARLERVADRARAQHLRIRAYVSTAFHCPFQGKVAPPAVVAIVRALRAAGIGEISLADTSGAAFPRDVARLLEALELEGGLAGVALHLHDTYGRALPNALVGLLHGVRELDSSAGGLGGCPFAPGAKGNVATEKLVEFLEGMGIATGVDVEKVRAARAKLGTALQGEPRA